MLKLDHTNTTNYNYSYRYFYGDFYKKTYDSNYIYDLPFSKSKSITISQGYNSSFSHKNINALDFSMPLGTEIRAIREGLVVKVVDKHKKGCGKRKCHKFLNKIIIYHSDGTTGEYSHIQKEALVKVGDRVKKGQIICYSGNTGLSFGPHLHLAVSCQGVGIGEFIQTKFKTGNGDTIEYLKEGITYTRSY